MAQKININNPNAVVNIDMTVEQMELIHIALLRLRNDMPGGDIISPNYYEEVELLTQMSDINNPVCDYANQGAAGWAY